MKFFFFSAKTHKLERPVRSIVTVRGTWQLQVSHFLFKHLNKLCLDDPFATKNSAMVTDFLSSGNTFRHVFSINVEGLFYSVLHVKLFPCVRECIDANGSTDLMNSCGLSVDNFLSLFEFYLRIALISSNDSIYVQRKGISIGSCVTPVL